MTITNEIFESLSVGTPVIVNSTCYLVSEKLTRNMILLVARNGGKEAALKRSLMGGFRLEFSLPAKGQSRRFSMHRRVTHFSL